MAAKKRKREDGINGSSGSSGSSVWERLRQVQRGCGGCNTTTLKKIFTAVQPFLNVSNIVNTTSDAELKDKGDAVVLELHGCVHCDDFVFKPDDTRLRCPKCDHPRFNSNKKPNEVCAVCLFFFYLANFWSNYLIMFGVLFVLFMQVFWYFPLKHQLAALLKNESYRELLMHETRRKSCAGRMSDVYDTPRWKKVAGRPTKKLSRVVIQVCVDGFPHSTRKQLASIMYICIILLSYFECIFTLFYIV